MVPVHCVVCGALSSRCRYSYYYCRVRGVRGVDGEALRTRQLAPNMGRQLARPQRVAVDGSNAADGRDIIILLDDRGNGLFVAALQSELEPASTLT